LADTIRWSQYPVLMDREVILTNKQTTRGRNT
jgi:hypothetical protein